MGDVVPLDNPSDYARVHRRIKRLWDEGTVVVLPHAQAALLKRRMDLTDVQHVVRHGSIVSHDRQKEQWRYRIQGSTVAGATASCIVALEGGVIIITVLGS